MTAYGSDTYIWDYRNRLTESTVSSNTDYYSYDHENIRIAKGDGTATTTYPNMYYNVKGATTTKHIYNPVTGELLATIEENGTATTTNYIHLDHLGSTNVVTDENGEVAQALDYYPYGELRIDDTTNFDETKKFTSHELDRSSDLTYAKQRYYDQDIGKFMSQDLASLNVATDQRKDSLLKDPQLQNFYSYSKNNPVNLTDPDGENPIILGGSFLLGAGTSYANDITTNRANGVDGWDAYRPADGWKNGLIRYAISGGETTFTAGASLGFPGISILGIGGVSGISSIATDFVSGSEINLKDAGLKAFFTTITAGIMKGAPAELSNSTKGILTGESINNIFEAGTNAFVKNEINSNQNSSSNKDNK